MLLFLYWKVNDIHKIFQMKEYSQTPVVQTLRGQSVMSNTAALLRTVKSSERTVRSAQTVTITQGPYAEHIRTVHLIITWGHNSLRFVRSVRSEDIRSVHLIITSEHKALRLIRSVQSVDIRRVHLIDPYGSTHGLYGPLRCGCIGQPSEGAIESVCI